MHRPTGMFARGLARSVPVGFLALFFALPVVTLLVGHLRAGNIVEVLGDPSLRRVAWFSLWQGAASTALTLTIGLPATWALSRWRFAGSRLLAASIGIPFLMPAVVMATGVAAVLPSRGIAAVLWAHVAFNLSVVLRVVGPTWALLEHRLEDSASGLGANGWNVFRHITWPAIRESVRNAAALVFVFCSTSFAAVSILGGVGMRTIESEIFIRAIRLGDVETAASLAVLQAAVIVVVLWLGRAKPSDITSGEAPDPRPIGARLRMRALPPVFASTAAAIALLPLAVVCLRSVRHDGAWNLAGWRALGDGTLRMVGVDVAVIARTTVVFAVSCAALSVVLALLACRRRSPTLAEKLSFAPLLVSSVTLGLGLVVAFDTAPIDWRSRAWLIPVVHAVIALPLAVRIIGPALRGLDEEMLAMAADLGAGPVRRWRSITIPLLAPALVRAAGISAAVSVGEFGATSFLTRSGTGTVSIAIAELMGRPGPILHQSDFALASSTVLIVAVGVGLQSSMSKRPFARISSAVNRRGWGGTP